MRAFKLIRVATSLVLLTLLALVVVNRLIRARLAAPRVRETGVPHGLLWRTVQIPTLRGKTLFGWFIPAGEGVPTLAVLHGWGGNAEMMLPLAETQADSLLAAGRLHSSGCHEHSAQL